MGEARLVLLEEDGVIRHGLARWTRLRPVISIGRNPDNDFVVNDPMVSAFHLTVFACDGHWTVVDRGSCNGTLVSRLPLAKGTRLKDGDEICIGRSRLLFEPAWPQPVRPAPPEPRPGHDRLAPEQTMACPGGARDEGSELARCEPWSPCEPDDELQGTLDELLDAFCVGLLDQLSVERAALLLPGDDSRLTPQAGWRWSVKGLRGIGRRTMAALLQGDLDALVWTDPGGTRAGSPGQRQPPRVHVLCPLPLDEEGLRARFWSYRSSPATDRPVGAIWLECRHVDPPQLRAIRAASQSLAAFLRQRDAEQATASH